MRLSKTHKENLLKLADFLENHVSERKFDMNLYRRKSENARRGCEYRSKNDCGTVGCALGWAPFVKGLEPVAEDFYEDYYDNHKSLDWERYCGRIFGFHGLSSRWNWCFDSGWREIDNTPRGAALRIRHMVEKGLPRNADFQLEGYDYYQFLGEI